MRAFQMLSAGRVGQLPILGACATHKALTKKSPKEKSPKDLCIGALDAIELVDRR